jgi:hypothetical protein
MENPIPKPLAPTTIDHKGVCEIIKVCVKSNIKELKFGELELTFFGSEAQIDDEVHVVSAAAIPRARLSQAKLNKMKSNDETILLSLAEQHKQDELDRLLMEDPAKFEDLVIAKELEALDGGEKED